MKDSLILKHAVDCGDESAYGKMRDTAEFQLLTVGENHGIAGHISLDVSRHSNGYSATGH